MGIVFCSERKNFGRYDIVKKNLKIMRKKLMACEMNSANEKRVQGEMKMKCKREWEQMKHAVKGGMKRWMKWEKDEKRTCNKRKLKQLKRENCLVGF